MNSDFNAKSYELHEKHYEQYADYAKLNSWKNKNTVDYWRHERMYSNLDPFIETYPNDSWLTVGDGRYGTDANYLISKGLKNVVATDISDTFLKVALQEGFISQYKTENAESLSFEDRSFDFVLCKEAYHHFPRPMIALYEMLRVAKKGVVLMEPNDGNVITPYRFKFPLVVKWLFQVVKNALKNILGRDSYYSHGNYEEVGNYVYSISEREIEKVALGLNYPMVSFKGINDCYIDGIEFEELSERSALFQEVKRTIESSDRKMSRGVQSPGMLMAVIFKSKPDENLVDQLQKKGFVNRTLPRNPYISNKE